MSSDYIYYVYAYIRSHDTKVAKAGTPYYIGKGKNKRAWNKHSNVKRPDDKSKIIILEQNLSEIGAFALERRMIEWYGREDIDVGGILRNKSEGGYYPGKLFHTEETKKMMVKTRIQNGTSARSKTCRDKISKAHKGKKKSEAHKKTLSIVWTELAKEKCKQEKMNILVLLPDGSRIHIQNRYEKVCFQNQYGIVADVFRYIMVNNKQKLRNPCKGMRIIDLDNFILIPNTN